ncbi:VOC family protein [candidate division KSB1 bacterium]|nr:VOC family protein [candidate division KSB1 bacterium]
MQKITTCLWFDGNAEAAVNFYLSVFKNSKIGTTARYSEEVSKVAGLPANSVMTMTFTLNDHEFLALNGGPMFKFSPAVSFMVHCETQEEIDYYWDKLSAGGKPSQCGWLDDQFGVSWQIMPSMLGQLMSDPVKGKRVMAALMPMTKLDIATLKQAAES